MLLKNRVARNILPLWDDLASVRATSRSDQSAKVDPNAAVQSFVYSLPSGPVIVSKSSGRGVRGGTTAPGLELVEPGVVHLPEHWPEEPVGARHSAALCDLRIFMDQASEAITSDDLDVALGRVRKSA